jgi:hypothetical protein
MRILSTIFFIALASYAFNQTHKDWMGKIHTIEEAERYASKHHDVIVSFVNPEQDVFLFDNVNMNNMSSHVGETKDLFGRSTKFLVDTTISMSNVKAIYFDVNDVQYATMDKLVHEIELSLSQGKTYWDIQKDLNDTDAVFWSGPKRTDEVQSDFNIDLEDSTVGSVIPIYSKGVKSGVVIVTDTPHDVKGFYSITYTSVLKEK